MQFEKYYWKYECDILKELNIAELLLCPGIQGPKPTDQDKKNEKFKTGLDQYQKKWKSRANSDCSVPEVRAGASSLEVRGFLIAPIINVRDIEWNDSDSKSLELSDSLYNF